jgi:hypothetical protein
MPTVCNRIGAFQRSSAISIILLLPVLTFSPMSQHRRPSRSLAYHHHAVDIDSVKDQSHRLDCSIICCVASPSPSIWQANAALPLPHKIQSQVLSIIHLDFQLSAN